MNPAPPFLPNKSFLIGVLLAFCHYLPAQAETMTGSIVGRVQNVLTGAYLNQARVSLQGTHHTVFTDPFGQFRLMNVPAGLVVIEIFYTGLDTQKITVEVPAGATVEREIGLSSSSRPGMEGPVVQLDAYQVSVDREMTAQALATNEQRFASNIKSVVSTDSLGDVLGGNVGEFMKMLPGVVAGYSGSEIIGISVRGFGAAQTTVASDGVAMASAEFVARRDFNMLNTSLTDVSRIEVTKVPLPADSADSIGGTVNMITKSAFERSKPKLNLGVTMTGNSEEPTTFKKTPQILDDRKVHKVKLGYDFDYTLPINKDIGIVLTGMYNKRFTPLHYAMPLWNTGGTATGASVTSPYLQSYQVNTWWKEQWKSTLSSRMDWRFLKNSVLTFSYNWNDVTTKNSGIIYLPNVGAAGTATPATGTPLTYGPTFSSGATGRGAVTLSGSNDHFEYDKTMARIGYRFDNGIWKIDATVSDAKATRIRPQPDKKNDFSAVNGALSVTGARIVFSDITPTRPGRVQAFNAAGQEIDLNDLGNYRINNANIRTDSITTNLKYAGVNARRSIDRFSFPLYIQTGGAWRSQDRDFRSTQNAYTYNGRTGDLTPKPYAFQNWVGEDAGYGFRGVPAYSVSRVYDAWLATPALFTQTDAQKRTAETYRITNSEFFEESITAGYLQAETRFLSERLKVIGGFRLERVETEGVGSLSDPDAVWQRNSDGSFARDGQGIRIRKPEAGPANSMEELRLTQQERAARAARAYDNLFPSIHINFDVTRNLILRAAYANTYARPNFVNIIPRTTVSENDLSQEDLLDPTVIRGTLNIRNTALKPWFADNYDLSVEYYSDAGGVLSGGVFLKDIRDFFGNDVRVATPALLQELGLNSRYTGWNLVTQFNSGNAKITGYELNLRQSLRRLGNLGRHFTIFANMTRLQLEGGRDADFSNFVPKSANWGFTFSRKPISFTARWTYRSPVRLAADPNYGPDAYSYLSYDTILDLNFAYQLTRQLALHVSINNATDYRETTYSRGSQTPGYAGITIMREYGTTCGVALKASF